MNKELSFKYHTKKWKFQRAFTLVELLVVIAIVGILATILLSAFSNSQKRSRDAQRKSDVKEISQALELFFNDHKIYPPADGLSGQILSCPYNISNPNPCPWGEGEMSDGQTTYFRIIPSDPINSQNYYYRTLKNQQAYQLYAHLENNEDKNCIKDVEGVPNCQAPSIPDGIDCGKICNFALTSPNVSANDAD